jgi:hypothetical protein
MLRYEVKTSVISTAKFMSQSRSVFTVLWWRFRVHCALVEVLLRVMLTLVSRLRKNLHLKYAGCGIGGGGVGKAAVGILTPTVKDLVQK